MDDLRLVRRWVVQGGSLQAVWELRAEPLAWGELFSIQEDRIQEEEEEKKA
jgi:hypothetical protein